MYEAGHSEDCLSTWNRPPGDGISEPKLLHADRVNKLETQFWLNENQELAKNGNFASLLQSLKEGFKSTIWCRISKQIHHKLCIPKKV